MSFNSILKFVSNPLQRNLEDNNLNSPPPQSWSKRKKVQQQTLRNKNNSSSNTNNNNNNSVGGYYLKQLQGIYLYGVESIYNITLKIAKSFKNSKSTSFKNRNRDNLKSKVQNRLSKPKIKYIKYIRTENLDQKMVDSDEKVVQDYNITKENNEQEVIDLISDDEEEDSNSSNNNQINNQTLNTNISTNTNYNNNNNNNNINNNVGLNGNEREQYYTPSFNRLSNINSLRADVDRVKNKNSIENLIKNYQKSLSLSISYPNQNNRDGNNLSLNTHSKQSYNGLVNTNTVNNNNNNEPILYGSNSELKLSDLQSSLGSSFSTSTRYPSFKPTTPTLSNGTVTFNNNFELQSPFTFTGNNNSIPTNKPNNLITSLRPRSDASPSVNKQDTYQVDLVKQRIRDSETKELLEKLDKLHQTNKYHILKQINERIEKEKNQKPVCRPPTGEEEKKIKEILGGSDPDTVLANLRNNPVARSDIRTLQHGKWLNDAVINFYIELFGARQLEEPSRYPKCQFFNTYFYQLLGDNNNTYNYNRVKKWTNSIDIFSMDKIIIPIHLGNHWCLAIINLKLKQFEYYDSLLGNNEECVNKLKRYLQDEMNNRNKKGIINVGEFKVLFPKDIPCQNNGYDCGVFMCKFADYAARDVPFTFTQKDITIYRRMMILEIINKKIF